MKKYLVLVGLAGIVTAGCSSGTPTAKTVADAEVTTTSSSSTTTTTMAPTTTTTVCEVDTAGPASRLQANQSQLDSLITGRRQPESAVAQIQLVIDNAGRSIDGYRRNLAVAQHDYDLAQREVQFLPLDDARDKLQQAGDNLADWKGIVASWEATRTKALGDLARGKATLADWDEEIAEGRRAIATNRAAQSTLTCS